MIWLNKFLSAIIKGAGERFVAKAWGHGGSVEANFRGDNRKFENGRQKTSSTLRAFPVTLPRPFVFARCAGTFDQIVGIREALRDSSIHRKSKSVFLTTVCVSFSFKEMEIARWNNFYVKNGIRKWTIYNN